MEIKPIKTDQEYYKALARLEDIFDAPVNSVEGNEAEILCKLIENFEDKFYPIEIGESKT